MITRNTLRGAPVRTGLGARVAAIAILGGLATTALLLPDTALAQPGVRLSAVSAALRRSAGWR